MSGVCAKCGASERAVRDTAKRREQARCEAAAWEEGYGALVDVLDRIRGMASTNKPSKALLEQIIAEVDAADV